MELVYLWVEEYKNIHRQGFNFSPKFECKFHDEYDEDGELKDNCQLEIIEKKEDEYIKDFFGKNINVTAIVGKNGTGKSSLLEIIEKILTEKASGNNTDLFQSYNNRIPEPIFINEYRRMRGYYLLTRNILIFSEKNKLHMTGNMFDKRLPTHKYLKDANEEFSPRYLFYYPDKLYSFAKKEVDQYKYRVSHDSILPLLAKYLNSNINIATFMYLPNEITLYQNNGMLRNILSEILPRSDKEGSSTSFDECHELREEYRTENILEAFFLHRIIENKLLFHLCQEGFGEKGRYDTEVLEDFYNRKEYALNEENYSLDEFGSILERKKILNSNENTKELEVLNKYHKFLQYNFEDEKGRKYNDLSHGEKTIFGQLVNIYDKINTGDNIIVFLDEPDISLHPDWQRKYISELNNIFFKVGKAAHFVVTTHSPFLLSDIPKQNIIFLDKDADGKCIVADGLKEKKQTFGANIHTLLSDSFFMEDGLMGEFAKGKIDKAIKYLNQEKLNEKELKYCEQIISIVGEPIVKNQLQRMLDSKRLKKVDEIDAIKQSMDAMQKRLDELEND